MNRIFQLPIAYKIAIFTVLLSLSIDSSIYSNFRLDFISNIISFNPVAIVFITQIKCADSIFALLFLLSSLNCSRSKPDSK